MTPLLRISAPILSAVRSTIQPFASQTNFLDPQFTKDGDPYGPERFKQITKERYYITKYTNTSYLDVGKITPTERDLLMSFIKEDLEKTKESLEKSKKDIESASAGIPAQRR